VGRVFSVWGPGRFSAILIVAALLFCHGAFGYAHQLPSVDAQVERTVHPAHDADPATAGHAAGVHGPVGDGDAEAMHLGGAYSATLLLLLFGAVLLVGARASRGARLPAPGHRVGRGPFGLRAPRGPTIPRLQVFRL